MDTDTAYPDGEEGMRPIDMARWKARTVAGSTSGGGAIVAAPTAPTTPKRETTDPVVRFSPAAYAKLEALATKEGKSPEKYVEDAIGMIRWIDEALADGGKIIVRRKHGPSEVLRARR